MSTLISISLDSDSSVFEDFVNLHTAASPLPSSSSSESAEPVSSVAASAAPAAVSKRSGVLTKASSLPARPSSSSYSVGPSCSAEPVSVLRNETLLARVCNVLMSRHLAATSSSAPVSSTTSSAEIQTDSAALSAGLSPSFDSPRSQRGTLFVTNYRVRFECASVGVWELAITSLVNVEKLGGPGMQASVSWFSAASSSPELPPAIVLHSRDARPPTRFEFPDDAAGLDNLSRCATFDLLFGLAFHRSPRDAFALQQRDDEARVTTGFVADVAAEVAAADEHVFDYDSDLDADLVRMGIRDAPCVCQRATSVLESSQVPSPSLTPSPSPPAAAAALAAPPTFSRFVQGLFAVEPAASELASVPASVAAGLAAAPPAPPADVAALNFEEAMNEARRLFPRCVKCSGWRVSRANERGAICPTYPDRLIVPAALSDGDVAAAAAHRSSQRFVVLGYRHAASGGVILRASQPRSGISGHRHRADELLVQAARRACSRSDEPNDGPPLLIVDARPVANAMANMALGGGYESTLHYVHSSLSFRGIANIHAVKTNLQRLTAACAEADASPDCARVAQVAGAWLEQLRRVLDAAQGCALHASAGGAVLLHCSDGWDRTPQVLILARLLLDSSARTARGLCALLRSQWLALGHKSAERLGLGERGDSKEQSPVLLQTLECVWNVWQQHPTSFEFTPKLLALLLHYSTSARFASFFGNSERERVALGVPVRGACLWRYLLSGEAEREHGAWSNPLYDAQASGGAPLRLAVGGCDVQLWTAMHRRGLDGSLSTSAQQQQQQQQLQQALWCELPLTFESESSVLQRTRALVRSRDDF